MKKPTDRLLAVSLRQRKHMIRDFISVALVAVGLTVSAAAVCTSVADLSTQSIARR